MMVAMSLEIPLPAQIRRRLGGDPQELRHHLLAAVALERGMTGERAEQRCAQPVHVGGLMGASPLRISGAVNAGEPVKIRWRAETPGR